MSIWPHEHKQIPELLEYQLFEQTLDSLTLANPTQPPLLTM